MIDITEIVVAVIGLLSVIVTSVVVPLYTYIYSTASGRASATMRWPVSRRRRSSLTHREKEPRSLPGPRTILSSSVRRTASRSTPIQSRSPLRMPGRHWGWTKNKLSVKRNRPLCK